MAHIQQQRPLRITSQSKKQSNADEYACVRSSGKRRDYLNWDTYFMGVAFLTGMRSKDPSTQVGACIVNANNRIVGVGYNGFPAGIKDEELPWEKDSPEGMLATKYPYVCHAELNAVLNKNVESCTGCRLYSTLYPCNECAKVIIQSGIRHVIYASDKNKDKDVFKASKRLFQLAGIKTEFWSPPAGSEIRIPLYYDDELPQAAVDVDDVDSSAESTTDQEPRRGGSSSSSSQGRSPPRTRGASGHEIWAVVAEGEQGTIEAAFTNEHSVRFVASGAEGLNLLRAGLRPTVLLLDVASVGKRGVDLCRTIRGELGVTSTSMAIVVLCPEKRSNEVACRYLEAGCDDYITTPLVKPLIYARVSAALQARPGAAVKDPMVAAVSDRHLQLTSLAEEVAQIQGCCRPVPQLPPRPVKVTLLACDIAALCRKKPGQVATLQDTLLLDRVLGVFDDVARKHGVHRREAQTDPYIFEAGHEVSANTAAAAVACGLAMIQAWRSLRLPAATGGARVRLGLHTGEIGGCEPHEGDPLFGKAVDAARTLQVRGVAECLHISDETRGELGQDFLKTCGAQVVQRPGSAAAGSPTHLVVPADVWDELQELLSARAGITAARATPRPSQPSHLEEYIKESSRACYPGAHIDVQ